MSEPLRSSDPSRIAGFRLLRRLGAGGMGVVYLGRTDSGALAAVKVIRGEGAGDDGFRARFAREVELARRVESPWVVPVLDADAEAREPWLATAFVPGPSVAEAVAAHGPLPSRAVRVLGGLLAEALDGVHAAGLIHRDVKPANVLLAADGPRLIDFGIARAVGATALTTDGSVVGSPGYLSPEQARGHTVGPPSDVFSLGCVLAHAATGRPAFGTGGAAAVLYRTVHEEPDLVGVPEWLDRTVRRCLAKEPARRPSAGELGEFFGEFAVGRWLPEGLPALVAARAARVLDLPVPDPTAVAGPSPVDARPHPPAAACSSRGPRPVPPRRPGRARGGSGAAPARPRARAPSRGPGRWSPCSAARATPSSPPMSAGPASPSTGTTQDARRTVDLVLRTADDHGTAAGSAEAAARLAADPDVSVVVAAGTNVTVPAALPPCTKARLTVLVTRADSEELNAVNTTTALVLRSTRTLGPHAALRYLNRVVQPARTVVVHDLATEVESLPTVRITTVHGKLDSETAVEEVAVDEDFSGAARRIAARPRDAVLFAGVSPDRAAACARALRDAGHQGARIAGEHVLGAPFLAVGEDWRIGTGYTDASADSRTKEFAAAFRARHRGAPGPWAAEAYDAVRFAARGLASVGDGGRSTLRSELLRGPWQGITRRVSFEPTLQYFQGGDDSGGFLFRVTAGAARFVARSDDIGKKT